MDGINMGQERRAAAARWTVLLALRVVLRAALLTLPLLALRALFSSREHSLSRLSDRQLGDIGLTRADVTRPHERTGSAELEMQRMRTWR